MKAICLVLMSAAWLLGGCSEIETPSAQDAMTHPFGTQPPFARGTSKAEIEDSWGPPDAKIPMGVDELGTTREEWIYRGRVPSLPFDYEYVSRTKHLFFEGKNLVRCTTDETNNSS